MALIAMAVYDTVENQRSKYTEVTLKCLAETVTDDRIIIVDNASCEETKELLKASPFEVITNKENVGTAKAINQAWAFKEPKQHLVKMDNDVDIQYYEWIKELEEAIDRDNNIGIIGLKRKDLLENPFRNDIYKSELRMLPHIIGQRWIVVEDVQHVIGTCQMYNYRLIDKIGGMMQPGIYGFDDALAAVRCQVSGFVNCFLPHIEIEHIDTGENIYQKEKERLALNDMSEYNRLKNDLLTGRLNPFVKL
jgi:GT2 family glycosyltransferase